MDQQLATQQNGKRIFGIGRGIGKYIQCIHDWILYIFYFFRDWRRYKLCVEIHADMTDRTGVRATDCYLQFAV
jgi:hypothetical protein